MELYEHGVFRVGDCISPLATHGNNCMVDFVGGNLLIHTMVYRPQSELKELADIDKNGLRLGVCTYRNAMMMAVKVGDLPWQDAPYTPHLTLAEDLPENNLLSSEEGLVACHLLVDSSEGRILQINPFGISSHFSNYLINTIWALKKEPFDRDEYVSTVKDFQMHYSPRDVGVRLSKDYFRLPPRNK